MRHVNPHYLRKFLAGLGGLADSDAEVGKYEDVDPNDASQIKPIIERELKTAFVEDMPQRSLSIAKLTLQFYLTVGGMNWQRMFDAHLLPFDPPADPRDFFLWVWEVFYPGEDYRLARTDDVEVVSDPAAPTRDAAEERRKST